MTQYTEALSGNVTPEMIAVAESEFLEPEFIRQKIAEGRLVMPANTVHLRKKLLPIGIALRTKINANYVGTVRPFRLLFVILCLQLFRPCVRIGA
jgi:phosphomethylpyrimidine synthase